MYLKEFGFTLEDYNKFRGYIKKHLKNDRGKDGLSREAEDVVQTSIMKALEKYDPSKGKFTAILYKIADDEITNLRRGDIPALSIEDLPQEDLSSPTLEETFAEELQRIMRLEEINRLEHTPAEELPKEERVWKHLTSGDWETLRLFNEVMNREWVADETDKSRNALRQRIFHIFSKVGGENIERFCNAPSEIVGREAIRKKVVWLTRMGQKAHALARCPTHVWPEENGISKRTTGQTEHNRDFGFDLVDTSAKFVNDHEAEEPGSTKDFQVKIYKGTEPKGKRRLTRLQEMMGEWESTAQKRNLYDYVLKKGAKEDA